MIYISCLARMFRCQEIPAHPARTTHCPDPKKFKERQASSHHELLFAFIDRIIHHVRAIHWGHYTYKLLSAMR